MEMLFSTNFEIRILVISALRYKKCIVQETAFEAFPDVLNISKYHDMIITKYKFDGKGYFIRWFVVKYLWHPIVQMSIKRQMYFLLLYVLLEFSQLHIYNISI